MKTALNNNQFHPVFTSTIPDDLDPNKLYISLEYNSVVHLCACGCGEEVVTPLQPAAWKLIYDGESVSLHPSIGNWSYKCRSHYWIKQNQIVWAEDWTDEQIKRSRNLDAQKNRQVTQPTTPAQSSTGKSESQKSENPLTLWNLIKSLFK
jgi:hypothetical protein